MRYIDIIKKNSLDTLKDTKVSSLLVGGDNFVVSLKWSAIDSSTINNSL